MINNSYKFSLKLHLALKSIDEIMTYSPSNKAFKKYFEQKFEPGIIHAIKMDNPQIAHKNTTFHKDSFYNAIFLIKEVSAEIEKTLEKEKRRNVVTGLNVLNDELGKLMMILFEFLSL